MDAGAAIITGGVAGGNLNNGVDSGDRNYVGDGCRKHL